MTAQLLPELIVLFRLRLLSDLWAALRRVRLIGMLLSVAVVGLALTDKAHAQGMPSSTPYPLMDHRVPTGTWGEWVQAAGRVAPTDFQSVRVELPAAGRVTWFEGARDNSKAGPQVRLLVGQTYRFRLSDLADFPGVELYPSIEVLDRLHPPSGQADNFPIPVTFDVEELASVIEGRMLTKVVYLEQPQYALPFELSGDTAVRTVNAQTNLIEESDKAGRPLAIIRLGGRQPTRHETHGPFFGSGAPLVIVKSSATKKTGIQPAITFSEAQPRVNLASHQSAQDPPTQKSFPIAASPKLADVYPDEYLFDGGDQGFPVHYDRELMRGIESEDTVAEYQDSHGNRRVKASNRVAIYAPRFAAVRAIHGVQENFNVQRLAGNFDQIQGAGLKHRVSGKTHLQRDRSQSVRMRSRASGVLAKATNEGVNGAKVIAQNTKLINLYEDVQFIRDGQFRQSELARLHRGMNAAIAWSRDLNPVIVANLSPAQEVYANFKIAEMVGIEDEHKRPGRLRIVKLADKDAAKPGDVVTFTIRFDNLGDKPLTQIRIIDNLTPRLEFVEDSATSDREGSINVDDNGEGSHIIRFELDAPLDGHAGGVITFQAKVR